MKDGTRSRMKSKSSTNSPADKVNNECLMTTDEICRIVEICGKSGVAELRVNGLEVKYNSVLPRVIEIERGAAPLVAGVTEPTELTSEQKKDMASHEEDNLAVVDPVEYERRVMMAFEEGSVNATDARSE